MQPSKESNANVLSGVETVLQRKVAEGKLTEDEMRSILHVHREMTVIECSNDEALEKLMRGEITAGEYEAIIESNNHESGKISEGASITPPMMTARIVRCGQFSIAGGGVSARRRASVKAVRAFEVELAASPACPKSLRISPGVHLLW